MCLGMTRLCGPAGAVYTVGMGRLWARSIGLVVIATAASLAGAAAPDSADAATTESAVYLLRQTLQVGSDGRYGRLLRSLRHLADPQLAPLYERLAVQSHPTLRVHGLLGLAECSTPREVDLTRLTELHDSVALAELLSAALDIDLLTTDQARQLMTWTDLDPGVKLVLATHLIGEPRFEYTSLLEESLSSPKLGQRGLAAMLLLQLGRPEGLDALMATSESDDPQRDQVRQMLLRTAIQLEYDKVAPWAAAVSVEPAAALRLRLLALQAALRFGEPSAGETWRQLYESSEDEAARTRLAILLLQMSQWVSAEMFEPLVASENELIRQIGAAGRSIATGEQVAEALRALVRLQHPIVNSWVLGYAKRDAPPAVAQAVLLELIRAYDGPSRNLAQRLDNAVAAAQTLFELDAAAAKQALLPVLSAADADKTLVQAILLGLIRSQAQDPYQVVESLAPLQDQAARGLVLLLRARREHRLSEADLRDLGLMVRGGGGFQDTLRIQAAWLYARHTGQVKTVLGQVLSSTGS